MRPFAFTLVFVVGSLAAHGEESRAGKETVASAAAAQQDATLELKDVVAQLDTLDTSLDDANKRLEGQQQQLATADRAVADRTQRIHDLEMHIDDAQATLSELEARRRRLDGDRQQQVERIAAHLRDAWRFAHQDVLKTLLSQEEPATFERMIRYHGYFAKARAAEVDKLRTTLATLADNERRIAQQRQALRTNRTAVREEYAVLLTERDSRRQLVAGLRMDLSNLREQRERLTASRQRLESLVQELQRQAALAAKELAGAGLGAEGSLPWPVDGRLHRRFGQPRAGGRMHWQGVYILAPLGSDVRAVASGRVVFADWLRGFGLLAIVDHGDSQISLYGYADALYKRVGDLVEGGEIIAAAGQSGGQDQVGLYFEMRQAGKPINPQTWLKAQSEDAESTAEASR